MDAKANEIVNHQYQYLEKVINKSINQQAGLKDISIPLVIEQNFFSFSKSIHEIKGSTAKAKLFQNGLDKYEDDIKVRFKDKDSRIKSASKNICAYSGQLIESSSGEIDHIIPRSLSLKEFGTIFNSEANLIYVSSDSNRAKSNKLYELKDLHPNYLEKVFYTSDRHEIENLIKDCFMPLVRYGGAKSFREYDLDQQKILRHALFVKEIRRMLFTY